MKRLLSTIALVCVVLGVGALAVLARAGTLNNTAAVVPGQASEPGVEAAEAVAPASEQDVLAPEEPNATENYNVIAMPLDAHSQFISKGLTWNADGLAKYIGAAPGGPVQQVLRLNAASQTYETWLPEFEDGENFPLTVGGVYWMLLDNSDPTLAVFSIVGDVPAQQSIRFNLVGNSGSCKYNEISIPLDKSDVPNADELAIDINTAAGGQIVEQVLRFNAQAQTFSTWLPEFQDGENFQVKIGYSYHVCLKGNVAWPQY